MLLERILKKNAFLDRGFQNLTKTYLQQSVDTKSLSSLGLYKDQLRTQILKNKYQLGTKSDSKKENKGPGLKVIF